MEKFVTYSVVPRINPSNREQPAKYYAQAKANGEMGFEEIGERLQRECTLTRADVSAVLVALEDIVADGIASGQIVRLGNLCSLQISLSGKGTIAEKDYTPSNILSKKIIFRSGTRLKSALQTVVFKKAPKLATKDAANGDSDGPGVMV